jgi:LPXTG-motif cell wall-anchored protein
MTGVVAIAAALWVVGAAGVAGAQTTCSFTVDPTSLPAGGGSVSVSGTSAPNAVIRISVNGTQVAEITAGAGGTWGPVVIGPISATSVISVTAGTYPPTPCLSAGNTEVTVTVAGAVTTLPRTGSNGVEPMVLAGLTVLVVGAVLTVATRRRESARGRI